MDPTLEQEYLQTLHEDILWGIGLNVLIFCALLFILFFVAMKSGKR